MNNSATPQRKLFTSADAHRVLSRIGKLLTKKELVTYTAFMDAQTISYRELVTKVNDRLNALAAMQDEMVLHIPLLIDRTTSLEQWQKRRVKQKKIFKKDTTTIDLLLKNIQQMAFDIWSLPLDGRDPLCKWHITGCGGQQLYSACSNLHQLLHKRIYRKDNDGSLYDNATLRSPSKRVDATNEDYRIKSVSDAPVTLDATLATAVDDITNKGQQIHEVIESNNFNVDTAQFFTLLSEFEVDFREVEAYEDTGDRSFEFIEILVGDIMSIHYQWTGKSERYTNPIYGGDETSGILFKVLTVLLAEFGYSIPRANLRRRIRQNADRLETMRIRDYVLQNHLHDLSKHPDELIEIIQNSAAVDNVRYRNKPVSAERWRNAISSAIKLGDMPQRKFKIEVKHNKNKVVA